MRIDRIIGRRRIVAALVACTLAIPVAPVQAGSPLPIRVNSTADEHDFFSGAGPCDTTFPPSGDCTLRAAIETANADPDESNIIFDIPGTGVHVIEVPSALPTIYEPLIIKGYTQAGSRVNTAAKGSNARLRVVLRHVDNPSAYAGLRATARVAIRGLVIQDFYRGIDLGAGADGSVIAGNFIGTNAAGTGGAGNDDTGVLVAGALDVTIGGPKLKDRNLIDANQSGILVNSATVEGLRIQGNLIGVGADGTAALGNASYGIDITGVGGAVIGGDTPVKANVIAYTGGVGISVEGLGRVVIARNSIFANLELGVDLGNDGPTPNDGAPDADVGPSGLQNFPVLSRAKTISGTTTVKGTLRSAPLRSFDLRFYSSGPGAPAGTGRVFLMKRTVTTNANGRHDFTFMTPAKVPLGRGITATATDRTTQSTSEFSNARTVTGP